jgi:uncharacterized repeat protein (TIGR01451 family)
MHWRKIVLTTIGVLMAATAVAWAQGHIKLTSVAQIEKEVFNEEGKKVVKRVPAEKVIPGTEVIFTTHYENISKDVAENAVITNPVPQHMIYQDGSARGGGAVITYSVDGGKTYDTPAKLFVFDKAGRKFAARPQDYTHIRWTFDTPLPSGAKGDVSFRAVLE